jgi:hypothetical protein
MRFTGPQTVMLNSFQHLGPQASSREMLNQVQHDGVAADWAAVA